MRQTLIRHHVERWTEPEQYEAEKPITTDDLVDRIFADCLGFLFVYCFTPEGCSLDIAQRRFIALTYIYRPDLIEGRSVQDIAREMNVGKGTIGQMLADLREEIGATGVNSMDADARRRVRVGQIWARISRADRGTD